MDFILYHVLLTINFHDDVNHTVFMQTSIDALSVLLHRRFFLVPGCHVEAKLLYNNAVVHMIKILILFSWF